MTYEKQNALKAKFFRYAETIFLWLLFFSPAIGFFILNASLEQVIAVWFALVLSAIGSHFCASHYEALLNKNQNNNE